MKAIFAIAGEPVRTGDALRLLPPETVDEDAEEVRVVPLTTGDADLLGWALNGAQPGEEVRVLRRGLTEIGSLFL